MQGTTSPSARYPRAFCLDANLSYKVGDALALVELPIIHVYRALPQHQGPVVGHCHAPDEVIAPWCAKTQHVLVTIDEDFKGRWLRSGLLAAHGVEVIVFDKDIPGLTAQHLRITTCLPWWQRTLEPHPYGHRVWLQTRKRVPILIRGKHTTRSTRLPSRTIA